MNKGMKGLALLLVLLTGLLPVTTGCTAKSSIVSTEEEELSVVSEKDAPFDPEKDSLLRPKKTEEVETAVPEQDHDQGAKLAAVDSHVHIVQGSEEPSVRLSEILANPLGSDHFSSFDASCFVTSSWNTKVATVFLSGMQIRMETTILIRPPGMYGMTHSAMVSENVLFRLRMK